MSRPSTPLTALSVSLALSLILLGVVALVTSERTGVAEETLAELRDGGDVLLFRHALTDRAQTDADPTARGGCDQQRNLSADGVSQAERIGQRLRDLAVPLGPAFASPFCRTLETAEAIVGEAEATDALVSLTAALDADGAREIVQAGAALITEQLGGPQVAVMVTHTQNIEELTGETVEEGDTVVLTVEAGVVTVLDVVPATAW